MLVDDLKEPKQRLFVHAYRISRNASDAMRKAGYKSKNPNVDGHRLLTKPHIQAAIKELDGNKAEEQKIEADNIIAKWGHIAFADARKLTSHRIGSCRYCHGIDGLYQWRTQREYDDALERAKKDHPERMDKWPNDHGGFGYSSTRRPHPGCPECDGLGQSFVVFADTDTLGPAEAALFAGVKTTKDGIEYKMHDPMKALDQLAEVLQVFKERDERKLSALADLLASVQGNALPIGAKNSNPKEEQNHV